MNLAEELTQANDVKDGRWQEIERLYNSALERKPDEREAYLRKACVEESLRKEVESLLTCQSEAKGFIESPALEAAVQDLACGQSSEASTALAGRSLSHYRILEKLGQGGMGVIYRAFDTHLNRPVALKVLPPDKVSDPERKRRFVKEARAASALNHPNIVTIHDIDRAEGVDFIAMEYVPGKTLDRQIPHKGMKIGTVLENAIQMADALSAAHSAGIIHRDLKPSNVMVSDSGRVKILDFGLAKLVEREALDDEEYPQADSQESSLRTDEGMILGTVAYMSPEQAQGKKVDARTDIFSFGAVLYEMVSGRKAFQGDGMASTLAAIIRDEPKPLSELAVGVAAELERIIRRSLRKDPERRWQTMSDLRVALRELSEESDSQPVGAVAPSLKRNHRRLLTALLALPLLAAAGWLTMQYAGRKISPPRLAQLTSYPGSEQFPCFSPDGRQVAFTWNGEKEDNDDIYVKLVGETNALRLTTDPAADLWPAWSPDGKRIAFRRNRPGASGIWWVSPLGGAEQKLADVQTMGQMSWSPDGKWLAIARGISIENVGDVRGIFLAPSDGGEPIRLSNTTAPSYDTSPSFSPDGRRLAYVSCTNQWSCDVFVQQLDDGYVPRGAPRPITRQGLYINSLAWGRDGGSLIYGGSWSWNHTFRLWRVGSNGGQQPERLDLAGFQASQPSVAPAGDRLAFSHITTKLEIWRYELGGVPESFLKSSFTSTFSPQFSPDGSKIAFDSSRSGDAMEIWIAGADGSRPVQLIKGLGRGQGSAHWSPDGRLIAFDSLGQDGMSHIYVIDANGGLPRRVTSGAFNEGMPSWSHDGRRIYFGSTRSGRHEIWRVPFGQGVAQQITENGGMTAFESIDGRTLFYVKNYRSPLFARSLDGGPEKQVLDFVSVNSFAVVEDGIYYYGRPGADNQHPIRFYEFSTGISRIITQVGSPPYWRMSVSPDRKTILFGTDATPGADLMLIENFR